AMAGLSTVDLLPLAWPLRAMGGVTWPPFATTYRTAPLPSALSLKRPSLPVRASANCLGAFVSAPHKATGDPATGAPPMITWPSMLTGAAGMHVEPSIPLDSRIAAMWFLPILNMGAIPLAGGLHFQVSRILASGGDKRHHPR